MNQLKTWIAKSDKDITLKSKGNKYFFKYNNILFSISKPDDDYPFYTVTGDKNKNFKWVEAINTYCISKKPKVDKLLSKIVKCIDIHEQQNQLCEEKNVEDKQFTDDDYYDLKNKLETYAKTSKSYLNDSNGKQMFDSKTVSDIIISDYLKCLKHWKNIYKNDEIELSLSKNNIYFWKIDLSKDLFKSTKFYEYCKHIQCVTIEIHFHAQFYPNFPPMIRIVKPFLENKLAHRIANSKIVQLDYWTPIRTINDIVTHILYIIGKFGKLDTGKQEVAQQKSVLYMQLETLLSKLSSFMDNVTVEDDIDDGKEFIQFTSKKSVSKTKTSDKSKSKYWKSGTGYGTSGSSTWDPTNYTKLQAEKDTQIYSIIDSIINILNSINDTNISQEAHPIYELLINSLLPTYLHKQSKTTLLDMQNREKTYNLYTRLLESLATEHFIGIFNIKIRDENIYNCLNEIKNAIKCSEKIGEKFELFTIFGNLFENIIDPLYKEYIDKNIKNNTVVITATNKIEKKNHQINESDKYVKELKPKLFTFCNLLNNGYKADYAKKLTSTMGTWQNCLKRLSTELSSFSQDGVLPLNINASIFVRADEDQPMAIRSLITGPPDTPYEGGCFIFDLYTSSNYPIEKPECWFMNHGGFRFNPNLYATGYVCLSILGTWRGTGGETWNASTSTLSQVLISIQSQILTDEPYFNEPGHESKIGTQFGKDASRKYNIDVRLHTMKHAIRDLLKNPNSYPQFSEVILSHFKITKDKIIKICNKWYEDIKDDMSIIASIKNQYNSVIEEINKLLSKL